MSVTSHLKHRAAVQAEAQSADSVNTETMHDRLYDVCEAYQGITDLLLACCTAKPADDEMHMVNPNHLYCLMRLLNEEMKDALSAG